MKNKKKNKKKKEKRAAARIAAAVAATAADDEDDEAAAQAAADAAIAASGKSMTFCYLMLGLMLLVDPDWLENLKLMSESPPPLSVRALCPIAI